MKSTSVWIYYYSSIMGRVNAKRAKYLFCSFFYNDRLLWDLPRGLEFLFVCLLRFIISFEESVTDVPCPTISFFICIFVVLLSFSVISPSSWAFVCLSIRLSVCLSVGAAVQSPCWVMKVCAIYSGQGGREWRWDVLYRHDCKDDLWVTNV